MRLKKHDRVEVVLPQEHRGMKGVILETGNKHCIVRITQAGQSHHTTKLIGEEITYEYNELKGI